LSRSVVLRLWNILEVDTCDFRSTQRTIFSVVGEPGLDTLLVEEMLVRVARQPNDSRIWNIYFTAN